MKSKNERIVYICILVILFFTTIILGGALWSKTDKKAQQENTLTESFILNVEPIHPKDIVVKNSYVGFVEAINQVSIIPYIDGYLDKIIVSPGDFVKEDDELITIEPSEYKAKLDIAEADIVRAQAAFEYAKNYYNRVKKSGKNAFSEIDIDNAKNNYLKAQAELKSAEANKKLALIDYQYTNIKAPISGLVGNFSLSRGDYVAPTESFLLNIIQTNPIRVVFSLTDKEYINMKNNTNLFKDSVIKLVLPNGKEFKYTGEFKYTDNHINKNTNSLAVYAYFKNDDNILLPNSFVTIDVYQTFKDSVLLNKDLIKMADSGYFLTIVRQNKIFNLPIEIISEKGNNYLIRNTFDKGDLLVLDDIEQIPNNKRIKLNIVKS